MVDPNALDAISDDVLRSRTLDRPPTNLRDIEYLYGTLYTLATAGEGEYDPYLTPDAAADLIGEANSLIVVNVDLSGPTQQFDSVEVMDYTHDLVDPVAHCKYSAARGMDHSISHQSSKSGNLPHQLALYAQERLARWPTDPLVREVANEHPEGDIIQRLGAFADNERVMDEVYNDTISALAAAGVFDSPEDSSEEQVDVPTVLQRFRAAETKDEREVVMADVDSEGYVDELPALITVRIKTDPDGDYRWPGDFDVLQEAMKTRRLGKFRSKNEADNSSGHGFDYITGDAARVVGTPEDPLKYYLSLQTERFPNFDADESWRNHPLSEDAALRILKSDEFIDACLYTGFGGRNLRVYYLPYFVGEPTVEKDRVLYRILAELTETDEPEKPPLIQAYNASGELRDDLRFVTIIVLYQHNERIDVVGEGMSRALVYPVELANAHHRVLGGEFFGTDGPFQTTETHPLLDPETDLFDAVATGRYPYYTFSDHEETSPMSNPVVDAFYTSVSGEPLNVATVLDEFVAAIDDYDTQEYGFPTSLLTAQLAQLVALSQTGLLSSTRDVEQPFLQFTDTTSTTQHMPNNNNNPLDEAEDDSTDQQTAPDELALDEGAPAADDLSARDRREKRLQQFLDAHPPLRDDAERRAAFILGALVGHLSNYQRWDGKHRTLADRHQITHLTKSNIKNVASNVLQKNKTYATESGYGMLMFGELTSRLMDTMQRRDPEEWALSVDDIRWHYGLGIAYGLEQAYADRMEAEETDDDEREGTDDPVRSSEDVDQEDPATPE